MEACVGLATAGSTSRWGLPSTTGRFTSNHLLADLFRRDSRWLSGKPDAIADDEAIDLKADRNEQLRLRADRIKPVVRVLIDLFDTLGEGGMRISE